MFKSVILYEHHLEQDNFVVKKAIYFSLRLVLLKNCIPYLIYKTQNKQKNIYTEAGYSLRSDQYVKKIKLNELRLESIVD